MDERARRAAGATGGMLDHALWYGRKGLSVIPLCWPESDDDGVSWRCGCGGCMQAGQAGEEGVGSRPLVDVQGLAGVVDEAQIRTWWTTWPEANIGLLLAPSGLLWVDVEGEEARREAQSMGMYLTRIVSTHRGFHYYYKKPEGCPVGRQTWQTEGGKIEISTAGYVVAPPSRHRLGERYLWRGERSTIQPPSWLVALLGQPSGPLRQALGRDLLSLASGNGAAGNDTTAAISVEPPEPTEPWSITESMLPPTTALSEELQIWEALGWITAEQLEVRCQVGQILHRWDRRGQGRGRGRLLWERWSECSSKEHLPAASQERLWQSFAAEETPGINEATASSLERLSALARQSRSGVVIIGKAVEQGCSRDDCGVLSRDDNRTNSRDDSEAMATTSSSSMLESSASVLESPSSGTVPLSLHTDSRQLAMDKDTVDLSEPEFVIMSALLSHHGKLVSFEQLADMLFHPDVLHQYANANESIRQLVCRIRNKMEQVGAERGWISNVRGLGYKLSLE